MRAAVSAIVLALVVSGCRSASATTPAEIEAALRARARTTLSDPELTLVSPYDAAATEPYASVVRAENARVRRLFAAAASPPVRLYLVPTAAHPGDEPWVRASVEGVSGGAFAADFGFVYVPEGTTDVSPLVGAALDAATVRHELAHLYARRAGLTRAPWFNEGLALEIESMRADGDALRPCVFPPALAVARDGYRPGTARELLAWRRRDGRPPDEVARLYVAAHALMRFLLARTSEPDVIAGAQRVLGSSDDEILALEERWAAWLAAQDALTAVASGTRSGDDDERAEAAALLPVLAERGAPELRTRAADDLALALLDDAACSTSAATFLLFFRAAALTGDDVARLSDSEDPVRALTGLALRARRGEPLDIDRARRMWASVPDAERRRVTVQAALIPALR